MNRTDATHDPALRSWVGAANEAGADFPIQNLPFGVFKRAAGKEAWRVGVAIGDQIVDVAALADAGELPDDAMAVATLGRQPALNAIMAAGRAPARALRRALSEWLREGSATGGARFLVPMLEAELALPAQIGDYTDFYAGIHHAMNVGSMFRPDNPLLPNYKWVPIGYHGRASSIVASGAPVQRPAGQTRDGHDGPPAFGPSRRLDYEVEVGVFIGAGNALGEPISIDRAEEHVFGLCLLNDWSARDIQTWEYQPLGPFLAKNFVTTISPWVVTMEALAPFRAPAFARAQGDPAPLPYLHSHNDTNTGGIDLTLELSITT
ncbi:MAG: fumarylacetoacetase, partial [Gemmatimonadaceae bacterium]